MLVAHHVFTGSQREEIANYLVPEVRVGCSSCLYRVTEGGNS